MEEIARMGLWRVEKSVIIQETGSVDRLSVKHVDRVQMKQSSKLEKGLNGIFYVWLLFLSFFGGKPKNLPQHLVFFLEYSILSLPLCCFVA